MGDSKPHCAADRRAQRVSQFTNSAIFSIASNVAGNVGCSDMNAHPVMEPTHENISGYEQLLGEDAAQFGGRNDGWGSMQQE